MRVSHPFVFEETSMRNELIEAILKNQAAFGLELASGDVERLADYYEIVQAKNPILHLVAPCSAEEFAVRHILESLTLLEYLPKGARFADVGTGAGLPSIPCLITREDLFAVLIESKQKKNAFLIDTLRKLDLSRRGRIIDRQFEEVKEDDFSFVTCRALDRFTEKLPRMVRWSGSRKKILFGGPTLEEALNSLKLGFEKKLLPMSERRYIFIVK